MRCISPYYEPKLGILCPCRQCLPCRINRRRDWVTRGILEMTDFDNATFITLTYDDENIPLNGSLRSSDLRNFWKRMRKHGLKFRYFACGEYGEKSFRPHYHAILYGVDSVTAEFYATKCWQFGFIYAVPATIETIKYVAGYVTKKIAVRRDVLECGCEPEFIRVSQGLGRSAIERLRPLALLQNDGLDILSKIKIGGIDYPIPAYVKKKLREIIFDDYYIDKLKSARIWNMQEENVNLVEKHLGVRCNEKSLVLKCNKLETNQSYLNLKSKDRIWNSRSGI